MSSVAQVTAPIERAPSLSLLEAAFEVCSQALAISEDGRVLFANQAFARQCGVAPGQQIVGSTLSDLIPRMTVPGNVRAADLRLAGRSLTAVSVEVQSPVPGPATQMEAMGRLVSGVAHDFNNLLTGILLYCDLLRRGLAENACLLRYVDEMHDAGLQGVTLIQQLLAAAGPRGVEPSMLSWNEAIETLQNLLQRLIGENIELLTDIDAGLGMVRMGPAQMPQIILNLVLNSRDAMPDGGRITLSTANYSAPGLAGADLDLVQYVEFAVTDTGCGIDEQTRSRMLDPFFTTKPTGQGNGLGLATVRRIVEEQGGTLRVESQPGRGTRMTVRLPRAPAADSTASSLHRFKLRGNPK
jgi:signal transduction histidine kinase